jgi:hypothetical protein
VAETQKQEAAPDAPAAARTEKGEVAHSVSRLVAEAKVLFGVASHVVAGALHPKSGDDQVSITEAKKAVAEFKDRTVN